MGDHEMQMHSPMSQASLQPEHHPPPKSIPRRVLYFFGTSEGVSLICVIVYFIVGAVYYTQAQNFTLLNALYFALGLATTVGFSDPSMDYHTSDGGKVFTAFYAIAALALVWVALLLLIRWFLQRREAWFNSVMKHTLSKVVSKKLTRQLTQHLSHQLERFGLLQRSWLYLKDSLVLQNALVTFCLIVLGIGVITHTESTTFVNSFHWVISCATTTGFDNYTVNSNSGRIFVLFWLIPMVASMASLMAALGQWILHTQYREIELFFHKELSNELLKRFDSNRDQCISREEWLAATLVAMGKVDVHDVDLIMSHFERLDTERQGILHLNDKGEIVSGGAAR